MGNIPFSNQALGSKVRTKVAVRKDMMRPFQAITYTLIFLIGIKLVFLQEVLAARFVDVSGNWAEKYINMLSDKGIIPATKDGKFHPNEPITRATLAAWLVKVLGIADQPVSQKPSFTDVKTSDWYYKPIEIIRQNNYISGYADGFRPNQYIQKAEVITIVSRTLNLTQPTETQVNEQLSKYKDSKKVHEWAKVGITQACQAGILITYPNPQILNPIALATRAETAALLANLDTYLAQQTIADATNNAQAPTNPPPNQVPVAGVNWGQNTARQVYAPPGNPFAAGAQPPPYYPGDQPLYQGQVSAQGMQTTQSMQGYPQQYYPGAYPPSYPPPGFYPQVPQYGQGGNYLQGGVATVAAGTHFRASLKNGLNSGSTQIGEEVQATLGEPLYSGGREVVPAGSRLIGQVTNVISAARFKAGANGKIDIRFTVIETPDGQRFPLSASIDTTSLRLTGGTTAGRVGKGLATTAVGAASGAALGTALGAIVGATSGGRVGKATGMGAVFGTAIGAGVGGVGAIARKGSEIKLLAGTSLPIRLDQSLQVTIGRYNPPYGNNYNAPPEQPPHYYPQ